MKVREGILRNGVSVPIFTNLVGFHALAKLLECGWTVQYVAADFIQMRRGDEVRIRCRLIGDDIANLTEVFLDQVYGYDFDGKTVLDIGSCDGDSTIFFCMLGARRVIALEPSSKSFELTCENVKLNGLEDRVTVLNAALSCRTGKIRLRKIEKSPSLNAIEPTDYFRATSQTSHIAFDSYEDVSTMTLADLFDMFHLEELDFLKLDCEGCEYDVIRTAPENLLRRVQHITMEFHSGIQDLPTLLARSGFLVTFQPNVVGMINAKRP